MSDVVQRLRDVAKVVFEGTPVVFAYLFGSHAARTPTPRSDIDVAVYRDPRSTADSLDLRLRLANDIERVAGIGNVEVVLLNEVPLSLAGRVQECHELIYSTNDIERVRYESLVSRQFHDFKVHEERSAHERLAHLAATR